MSVSISAINLLVAFVLSVFVPLAVATEPSIDADHIVGRAVFKDVDGTLGIEHVTDQDFTPAGHILAAGYTHGAEWLRLVVRPSVEGGELVLRIQPSYLNELTLYTPDPQRPGAWKKEVTGNATPWIQRSLSSVALGFSIHPLAETTYYLRLRTVSNSLLHVEALAPQVAAHADVQQWIWQGLFLAIILWVILWAIQDYLLSRDTVIASFAVAHFIYLLYGLAIMGYLSVLLPHAEFMPMLTSTLVALAVLASVTFHRQLLGLFAAARPALWSVNVLIAGSAIGLVLLVFGRTGQGLQLNSLMALLAGPLLFVAAMTTREDAFPGRIFLRGIYFILLLSLLSYIPPLLGIGAASVWTLNGALVQGLISAILISMFLHRRARQVIDDESRSRFRLALAKQQLASEQDRLAENTRFTAMLTHELKTPLAAIRLSLDAMDSAAPGESAESMTKRRTRIDRALANINGIVERCIQTDQLEQGKQPLRREACDLLTLLSEASTLSAAPQRLQVRAESPRLPLESDSTLLAVILANLIDNALKYSPPDSAIEIDITEATGPTDATPQAAGICLLITNPRISNDQPDPEKLFDKYYRGEHASRQSGSGLGLYLVQGLAHTLGGRIRFIPTTHKIGFELWLPIKPY